MPLVVALAVWQVVGEPGSSSFPPPVQWWHGLEGLWTKGLLLPAVGSTLATFGISLAIATAVGSAVGFAMGSHSRVDRALSPTFEFLRAIPPAALVPVAVLVIGYETSMKVLVVIVTAVWPVLLTTRSAARTAHPLLADVADTLGLSRAARLCKVSLPLMLPSVLLGARVAAPIALIITLLVEILTGVSGLGALIAEEQRKFHAAGVYGLVAVAGAIAVVLNWAVVWLERLVTWSHQPDSD